MRVVAGALGGRKLVCPEGEDTRPTSERVREAMFNSLFSLDAIDGARVLDLFAGSGALGIEALSRSAKHATFIEQDRAALAALRENVETLMIGSQCTVIAGDGLRHLESVGEYDLILLDPPYGFDGWDTLLSSIQSGTVVIESDREVNPPFGWVVHRVKRYGGTVVTLATAGPRGEEEE
jgi:16S rRNA (guanine966-N2)-methyltransferase